MVDVDISLADSASRRPRNNAGSGGGGGGGGAEDDEDGENEVFHFISYVHVHDTLYELDGLKKQPVRLRWYSPVRSHIAVAPTKSGPICNFRYVS